MLLKFSMNITAWLPETPFTSELLLWHSFFFFLMKIDCCPENGLDWAAMKVITLGTSVGMMTYLLLKKKEVVFIC